MPGSTTASPWAISTRCVTGATPMTRALLRAPPRVSSLLCSLYRAGKQVVEGLGLPVPRGAPAVTMHRASNSQQKSSPRALSRLAAQNSFRLVPYVRVAASCSHRAMESTSWLRPVSAQRAARTAWKTRSSSVICIEIPLPPKNITAQEIDVRLLASLKGCALAIATIRTAARAKRFSSPLYAQWFFGDASVASSPGKSLMPGRPPCLWIATS